MDTYGYVSEKIKEMEADRQSTKDEQNSGFNADPVNTDLLFPLLLAMLFTGKPSTPSLEERVAYLNGKVDTLEKVILKNA